jgi:hypothetical protein
MLAILHNQSTEGTRRRTCRRRKDVLKSEAQSREAHKTRMAFASTLRVADLVERVAFVSLLAGLFLYISVPALYVAGDDNDRSIRAVLNECAKVHCRNGVDFILTYGPTSWLANRAFDADLVKFQLGFWILTSIIACLGIAHVRRLPMGRPVAASITIGFFTTGVEPAYDVYFPDGFFLTMLSLLAIVLFRPLNSEARRAPNSHALFTALSLSWISIIAFTKGTLLLPAVAVMLLFVLQPGGETPLVVRGLRLALAACLLAGVWRISGQEFLDLPRYVYNMAHVIAGYPAGLTFLGIGSWSQNVLLGSLVLVPLISLYFATIRFMSSSVRPAVWKSALFIVGFCGFVAWKQTAETGGRVLLQVLPSLPGLLLLTVSIPGSGKPRTTALLLLGLCPAALGTYVYATAGGFDLAEVVRAKGQVVAQSYGYWSSPDARRTDKDRLLEETRARKRRLDLPGIRQRIGRDTVDMYGESQTIMVTNAFNWTPRPIYQSMAAFSPYLVEVNRARIAASPPRYVIVAQSSYRNYPAMDDWPWIELFLANYRFIARENGIDLYGYGRQMDELPISPKKVKAGTVPFSWEERIEVPRAINDYVEMRVSIGLSWIGRLRALLFQHPAVQIEVELADGQVRRHTLNIAAAPDGFMLSPYLESSRDVNLIEGSADIDNVKTVRLRTENWKTLFVAPTTVEFYQIHTQR